MESWKVAYYLSVKLHNYQKGSLSAEEYKEVLKIANTALAVKGVSMARWTLKGADKQMDKKAYRTIEKHMGNRDILFLISKLISFYNLPKKSWKYQNAIARYAPGSFLAEVIYRGLKSKIKVSNYALITTQSPKAKATDIDKCMGLPSLNKVKKKYFKFEEEYGDKLKYILHPRKDTALMDKLGIS